jgi:hypothetical protein
MYAQDEANIRGMQEQREVGDISALSSQYNAGNAMLWQGIGGVAQSGMAGLSNPKLWDGDGGGVGDKVDTTKTDNTGSTVMNNYMKNFGNGFNMSQFKQNV